MHEPGGPPSHGTGRRLHWPTAVPDVAARVPRAGPRIGGCILLAQGPLHAPCACSSCCYALTHCCHFGDPWSQVTIRKCNFTNNGGNGLAGTAVYVEFDGEVSLLAARNTFVRNSVRNTRAAGAAAGHVGLYGRGPQALACATPAHAMPARG